MYEHLFEQGNTTLEVYQAKMDALHAHTVRGTELVA